MKNEKRSSYLFPVVIGALLTCGVLMFQLPTWHFGFGGFGAGTAEASINPKVRIEKFYDPSLDLGTFMCFDVRALDDPEAYLEAIAAQTYADCPEGTYAVPVERFIFQ